MQCDRQCPQCVSPSLTHQYNMGIINVFPGTSGGHWVNFDLAWPSENGAIPDNWVPTNESYYGYTVGLSISTAEAFVEMFLDLRTWVSGTSHTRRCLALTGGPERVILPR